MKSIEINSLPVQEVLEDLANKFGTRCTQICDEYIVEIPSHWGQGYIKAIAFEGGMTLVQYLCMFHEDLEIKMVINEVHPVKFLYCLEGKMQHRFANSEQVTTLKTYQNAIVASKDNNGHVLRFKAGIKTNLCSLEITRAKFKPTIACYLENTGEAIQELFSDDAAKNSFYYKGHYSFRIAEYFETIEHFEYKDLIRRMFLEGKAYQILTSQLIQYEDDMQEDDMRKVLRPYEISSIVKAVRIIELELENLESVHSLATRVGLNQNKLQEGFHIMYSLSVNEYIQNERLKTAISLLKDTKNSMTEIMEKLGLSSKSYFSKIFRDRYDITPSTFRKNYNKHRESR